MSFIELRQIARPKNTNKAVVNQSASSNVKAESTSMKNPSVGPKNRVKNLSILSKVFFSGDKIFSNNQKAAINPPIINEKGTISIHSIILAS